MLVLPEDCAPNAKIPELVLPPKDAPYVAATKAVVEEKDVPLYNSTAVVVAPPTIIAASCVPPPFILCLALIKEPPAVQVEPLYSSVFEYTVPPV